MRRVVSTLLLLGLFIGILSGCGANSSPSESQQPTDTVQDDIQEPAETNSLDISSGPMFEFTRAAFVETADVAFQKYFDIHSAFANEPSVTESLGCLVYTYKVDDCTECIFYAHPETDNLIKVNIMGHSNIMTEENIDTFMFYAGYIATAFVSEDEEAEMREALAVETAPITQNAINFFHGSDAEFAYTISDGLLWLHIDPID